MPTDEREIARLREQRALGVLHRIASVFRDAGADLGADARLKILRKELNYTDFMLIAHGYPTLLSNTDALREAEAALRWIADHEGRRSQACAEHARAYFARQSERSET